MQLFFSQNIDNNCIQLHNDEARHCFVLRKKVGDNLNIINGEGAIYTACITHILKDKVIAEIIKKEIKSDLRPYYFHLAISPTKQSDRIEWMLEKCIEMGIDEISFIETQHSEKAKVNIERLKKISISAIKQSHHFKLPIINDIVKFNDFISCEREGTKAIAHCHDTDKLKVSDLKAKGNNVYTILIGPEGDFSDSEIKFAQNNHFITLDLGNSRLRTETAGLYVCAALKALLENQ